LSERWSRVSVQQRFEWIYANYYEAVLRYCLRRSKREDALDATAETFTVAWRRRVEMPKDQELPWLYGVARRVLANQRRSAGRQQMTVARLRAVRSDQVNEPEFELIRNEESRAVVLALSRLKPADREIIRLAGWEKLDRGGLALAMGCTPNAVTKRLNRALDHLAHEMGVVERTKGGFFRRGRVAT